MTWKLGSREEKRFIGMTLGINDRAQAEVPRFSTFHLFFPLHSPWSGADKLEGQRDRSEPRTQTQGTQTWVQSPLMTSGIDATFPLPSPSLTHVLHTLPPTPPLLKIKIVFWFPNNLIFQWIFQMNNLGGCMSWGSPEKRTIRVDR